MKVLKFTEFIDFHVHFFSWRLQFNNLNSFRNNCFNNYNYWTCLRYFNKLSYKMILDICSGKTTCISQHETETKASRFSWRIKILYAFMLNLFVQCIEKWKFFRLCFALTFHVKCSSYFLNFSICASGLICFSFPRNF